LFLLIYMYNTVTSGNLILLNTSLFNSRTFYYYRRQLYIFFAVNIFSYFVSSISSNVFPIPSDIFSITFISLHYFNYLFFLT
jgi:hypothetical protein